jgi:uncharacterized protein YndB with AHSA1/START domain
LSADVVDLFGIELLEEPVLAPAERIWHLLTDPRKLAQWTGSSWSKAPRAQ